MQYYWWLSILQSEEWKLVTGIMGFVALSVLLHILRFFLFLERDKKKNFVQLLELYLQSGR